MPQVGTCLSVYFVHLLFLLPLFAIFVVSDSEFTYDKCILLIPLRSILQVACSKYIRNVKCLYYFRTCGDRVVRLGTSIFPEMIHWFIWWGGGLYCNPNEIQGV